MDKRRWVLGFFLALVLLSASDAFALNCIQSQKLDAGDECWTQVRVSASETKVVSQGTVLVYDFASSEDDNDASVQVRVATTIDQGAIVAGIAQSTIATGDYGLVLVRGKGKVRVFGGTSSGDRLFVAANDGVLVNRASYDVASVSSNDKPIAFALETSAATNQTIDAFVVVV